MFVVVGFVAAVLGDSISARATPLLHALHDFCCCGPEGPDCLCSVGQVWVKHRTRTRCREQEQRGSALRRSLVFTWFYVLGFLRCRTETGVVSV